MLCFYFFFEETCTKTGVAIAHGFKNVLKMYKTEIVNRSLPYKRDH